MREGQERALPPFWWPRMQTHQGAGGHPLSSAHRQSLDVVCDQSGLEMHVPHSTACHRSSG